MHAAPTTVQPGDELELELTGIAHGGLAVGRHEGRVVFVADGIPGERVRVRITDAGKPAFWRADTVAVLEASPDRLPHLWPEAALERDPDQRPGGAEFGHIALERQRALKAQVLVEAWQRHARGQEPLLQEQLRLEVLEGQDERGGGWRSRVILQVAEDGAVGPYAARSHRVIPVTGLPLADPALLAIAELDTPVPGARRVELVATGEGELHRIVDGHGAEAVIAETVRTGTAGAAGERRFELAAGGFWQVHRGAAEWLSRTVQELVDAADFDEEAHHLDLYGGVGLFAAALVDRFGALMLDTVESDRLASDFAARNLGRPPVAGPAAGGSAGDVQAIDADVSRYLGHLLRSSDRAGLRRLSRGTVVLDPPRSGAGRKVVEQLLELAPRQLVYVACDPVALSRDLGYFAAGGYRVAGLRAADLFPNTHHFETVVRLQRDESRS